MAVFVSVKFARVSLTLCFLFFPFSYFSMALLDEKHDPVPGQRLQATQQVGTGLARYDGALAVPVPPGVQHSHQTPLHNQRLGPQAGSEAAHGLPLSFEVRRHDTNGSEKACSTEGHSVRPRRRAHLWAAAQACHANQGRDWTLLR